MAIDYTAAARAAARRYCGWHVTPVETETITVDGPGGLVLSLPTLRLVQLMSITENGRPVDPATLLVSPSTGQVRKRSGAYWTSNPGGITVEMEHGFDEAPDFDAAVEQAAAALQAASERRDPALIGQRVDDVEYRWAVTLLRDTPLNESMLAAYRILPQP